MVFDILFDDRDGCATNGGHKIGIGPERRQARTQGAKLLPEHARGFTFDEFDGTVDAVLRIYFQKQMHVVRHDFHFNDFDVLLGAALHDQLLQTSFYGTDQYFTSIFRTPDHMIFTGIEHVVVRFIVVHTTIIQLTHI